MRLDPCPGFNPITDIQRFVVKQFGHKLLDEAKNMFRCQLILERVSNQTPFNDVLRSPKPSQLDDWALYEKLVGDDYRKRQGDIEYSKWRDFEEEQRAEKEQFIKSKALCEGLRKYATEERTLGCRSQSLD